MKHVRLVVVSSILCLVAGVAMSQEPSTDRTPPHRNHLAGARSPYLLQHADNPVDWYPWGEEAFARARELDRPIFLSIGYATCHWCHVMEHESFTDREVARLMNETFVSVKVDREERPDVDQVYMSVCQMLTGSGGWPLTIVMTPDRQPFYAATYIPRETRYGRVGMLELVPRIAALWRDRRQELAASATEIVAALRRSSRPAAASAPGAELAERAFRELASRYDAEHGGFGGAPKFPSPHNLLFLLRHWRLSGEAKALEMAETTLEAMRRGGVYDQVGLGFHRYSTDSEWLVPHFEKMLYDQALLAIAYTEAFLATGKLEYEATAREVLTYMLRDLRAPEGAFYSAEDADSEGEEGKFYLWSSAELQAALGAEDAALAAAAWQVTDEGNFTSEVSGERTGANILHLPRPLATTATRLGLDPEKLASRLETIRAKLFADRERRVHPLKDDKVLADWNGLAVAALARAGCAFDEPSYTEAAATALSFVLDRMRDQHGGLLHRFHSGEAAVGAFLDDYAFLAWGALELYEATLDPAYLERALDLVGTTFERFSDDRGGLFFTADDAESLLVRHQERFDGAVPSGAAVTADNLVRLARLTGRSELEDRALRLLAALAPELERAPSAITHAVAALELARADSVEVVVAGEPGRADTKRLVSTARSRYLPQAVLLLVPSGESGRTIHRLAPFAGGFEPLEGRAAAFLCHDHRCDLPTSDPDELARRLASLARPPRASSRTPSASQP